MPSPTQIKAQQERAVLRAFRESVQAVRDQAVIKELAALISNGDVQGVVDLLQLDPTTFQPLEQSITTAYSTGGTATAEQIGRIPAASGAGTVVARFSVRAPEAEAWLRNLSSTKIVEITDETVGVVRGVLARGIEQGANPRTTALDLVGRIDRRTRKRVGGYIGVAENQAQWIANARADLEALDANYLTRELRDKRFDKTVARAIESGKPLKAEQIDTMITRMQANTLRYRGENIARTESLNALRAGQDQAIMQALDAGEVDRRETVKTWDATGGGRTRDAHADADGQTVPVDEPFIVGGEALMYPGDPAGSAAMTVNCRCSVSYKADFAGKYKRIKGF